MKLYNTASRQIEEVVALEDKKIKLYTCGPTVYDYQHIGNYISYLRWDILARTLAVAGYSVSWYMNITDVGHLVSDGDEGEDKLEKGAKREEKTAWEIADFYLDDFIQSITALNISIPRDHLVRATDHIADQIILIQKLEEKGYTYIIDDGVYFDSTKFVDYGKMARLDITGLQAGARVDVGQKKHSTDFALWKFCPAGQKRDMEWESPWGKGFPGWHIECSALAIKFLGESLDIHAGGIDHIPVHHTNEIAQSEAATGKLFVKTWIHGNFLQVDREKISKSLGNGYKLKDLAEKGFSPEDFRMFVLQSHFRSETHFSWDNLRAAQTRLKNYKAFADLYWALPDTPDRPSMLTATQQEITLALENDLDTPTVLVIFSKLESEWQRVLATENRQSFMQFLKFIDRALGLSLARTQNITSEQQRLIDMRDEARKYEDWTKADNLRDKLANQGIRIRDSSDSGVWYRT